MASAVESPGATDGVGDNPVLFRTESNANYSSQTNYNSVGASSTSYYDSDSSALRLEKPDNSTIQEIAGLLKVMEDNFCIP